MYLVRINGLALAARWGNPDDAQECARLLILGGISDVTWGA